MKKDVKVKRVKAWAVYDGILEKIVVGRHYGIYPNEIEARIEPWVFANDGQKEIRKIIPVEIHYKLPSVRKK